MIDDREIHQGDIMGLGDHSALLAVGSTPQEAVLEMLAKLVDEESELISLYYGADISEEEANRLAEEITERFPDCEVELNSGGQPIYYYILSVE